MRAPASPDPKKTAKPANVVDPVKPVGPETLAVVEDPPNVKVEVLKARLGFWQAIWGTILTSGVAVAIPAIVDTYKAGIERDIKQAELAKSQLDAHNSFVTQFLDTAVDQDIELRIRFSEYFSRVSADDYIDNWTGYVDSLKARRDDIRKNIDVKEARLRTLLAVPEATVEDRIEIDSLRRGLDWDYAEVGYARRNEDISIPRTVARTPGRSPSQVAADGNQFFRVAVIESGRRTELEIAADRMQAGRSRYETAAASTRFPWYFFAVLHQLEAGGDFNVGLDGQAVLTTGEDSATWEAVASRVAEMRLLSLDAPLAGTLGELLVHIEAFNGITYANRGVRSPYIWGCTDLYTGGAFLSGQFLPDERVNMCGAVAYLRALEERGEISLPPTERAAAAF